MAPGCQIGVNDNFWHRDESWRHDATKRHDLPKKIAKIFDEKNGRRRNFREDAERPKGPGLS